MMAREATYSVRIDTKQARAEVKRFIGDVQQEMGRMGQASAGPVGRTGGALGTMAVGAIGGLAGYFSVREIAQQASALSQLRSEVLQSDAAFLQLAGSEEQVTAYMAAMERVTGSAMDTLSQQQLASGALATGLASTSDELERVTRAAQGISIASPRIRDVSEAFEQLNLTIANQSTMRLDQLGLGVEEVTERAAELRRENSELSKEMAFQEAVLSIAEEKYGALSDSIEDTISGVQRLRVAWAEARQEIAASDFGDMIDAQIGGVADSIDHVAGMISGSNTSGIIAQLDALGNHFDNAYNRLRKADWLSGQQKALGELTRLLRQADEAVVAGVPGAKDFQEELAQIAAAVMRSNEVMPVHAEAISEAAARMANAAYVADNFAGSLDGVADSAANAAGALAGLGAQQFLQAQRAGLMTPGERERRANSEAIYETPQSEWERQYYLIKREQDEKAAAAVQRAWSGAASSTADAWADEIESALQGVSGLFDTSDVTQEDLDAAAAGRYQEKADEYLRQLRDEVRHGKDYAGVDIMDAAERAGIDPTLPAEEILKQFEQAWDDSSLFAGGKNLDLFNEEAVKREIEQQKASKAGEQAIIDYFTALYGPEAAEAAVGGASGYGGGYGYGGGGGGAAEGAYPLAATSAEGALKINEIVIPEAVATALQQQIDGLNIDLKMSPPADIAEEYMIGLSALFNAPGENEAVNHALGIGKNIQNWIGGGMVDFGAGEGESNADLAVAFLQGISTSFYAEDAQTKAKTIGQDVRIPFFSGFTDSETMPNFALPFVSNLRVQFQAETTTERLTSLGTIIAGLVYNGYLAGLPEYDWAGAIASVGASQAAEAAVDAMNESWDESADQPPAGFPINLP